MGFTADRLLLFGATGDLSQRMLLPSLCALHADDLLAPELKIVGTARSELSTSEFRNFAREALEKHLPAGRRGGVGTFLNRLSYQQLDASTIEGFDALALVSPRGAVEQNTLVILDRELSNDRSSALEVKEEVVTRGPEDLDVIVDIELGEVMT